MIAKVLRGYGMVRIIAARCLPAMLSGRTRMTIKRVIIVDPKSVAGKKGDIVALTRVNFCEELSGDAVAFYPESI